MKFEWVNNDTVALIFLGGVAIAGVCTGMETVVASALGAMGGYIGSKAVGGEK